MPRMLQETWRSPLSFASFSFDHSARPGQELCRLEPARYWAIGTPCPAERFARWRLRRSSYIRPGTVESHITNCRACLLPCAAIASGGTP